MIVTVHYAAGATGRTRRGSDGQLHQDVDTVAYENVNRVDRDRETLVLYTTRGTHYINLRHTLFVDQI